MSYQDIVLPPHGKLKIVPVDNAVYFPHNESNMIHRSPHPLIRALIQERFFITVYAEVIGENLRIPNVGTLAYVKKDAPKKNGAEHHFNLLLIQRVCLLNVSLTEIDGKMVLECGWEEMRDPEVSEETWNSEELRQNILKARTAFTNLAHTAIDFIDEYLELSENIQLASEDDRKIMIAERHEINRLVQEFTVVRRENLGIALDKLSGFISDFFTIFLGEDLEPEILTHLSGILWAQTVEERLLLFGTLIPKCQNYLEDLMTTGGTDEEPTGRIYPVGIKEDSLAKRFASVKDSLPPHVQEQIQQLLPRANPNSETGRINFEYIEWLLALPWTETSQDEDDFAEVKERLKRDHYGLEEAKECILDFLAVRRVKKDAKSPILLFVGPPGGGKTSLGESIARAMKRKFVRRSLSGIKDEAALRGHRRTYVGAIPGFIITELKRLGVKNPVFMLDEVDKLGEHGRDMPEHVLVELLDPQYNNSFRDNYIDLPFDLSEVLFIVTANTTDNISEPILNRAEKIEFPGYTEDEKVIIAEQYAIPKLHRECGITREELSAKNLPPFSVAFSRDALRAVINGYTSDAGMRDTERAIARVLRKILREVSESGALPRLSEEHQFSGEENRVEDNPEQICITAQNIGRYLGEPKRQIWFPDLENLKSGVGLVLMVDNNGLGIVGCVEASYRADARFDRKSTGSLQHVLEESIEVALSRLIHEGGILQGIKHKFFLHFHFPDGATRKDGPSAGLQTPVALYSRLLDVPVKKLFAATGEITLRRDVVLPVGGIQSKLLGAERVGLREVAIPFANRNELEKLPKQMRKNMRIIVSGEDARSTDDFRRISLEEKGHFTVYCVNTIEEVLAVAFPNHFPPPEGFVEEFNRKLLDKLRNNNYTDH